MDISLFSPGRSVVFDTETTGFASLGDNFRIVEIGAVELLDGQRTGRTYQQYIDPRCPVDSGALKVHGLSNEFLADYPPFAKIANDFLAFVGDARLIAYNIDFDIGALNAEFARLNLAAATKAVEPPYEEIDCGVDAMPHAKRILSLKGASMDKALAAAGITKDRPIHGALLDADLLADLWLDLLDRNNQAMADQLAGAAIEGFDGTPDPGFVHLDCHSHYDTLRATATPAELAKAAAAFGQPALALTDPNCSAVFEFEKACKEQKIGAIFGLTVPVLIGRYEGSVVLLAKSQTGLIAIYQIAGKTNGGATPVSQVDLVKALLPHADDLVVIIGEAFFATLIEKMALAAVRIAIEMFAEEAAPDLYLSICPHGQFTDAIRELAADCADIKGVTITGGGVQMARPTDLPALNAMATKLIERNKGRGVPVDVEPQAWLKPAQLMRNHATEAEMKTTITLADELVAAGVAPVHSKPQLPSFPSKKPVDELLTELAKAGLAERMAAAVFRPDLDAEARLHVLSEYQSRLDFEISVISKMGFEGYYLIEHDVIAWAKSQGILVGPGRGSGVGSLVAWSLGITDVDPIRFGLLFERFLNPDRVSPPDFDVDFAPGRRAEVIDYVAERYGADHVAHIATFGLLRTKAAFNAATKAFGLSSRMKAVINDSIADVISADEGEEDEEDATISFEELPKVTGLGDLMDAKPLVKLVFEHALGLADRVDNHGMHACGVVIGVKPLREIAPLIKDKSGATLVDWSMKSVETAGLIKFDFLGLTALDILQRTIALSGEQIDLAAIPFDDAEVFEMMARGETDGVFQFDGAGMRKTLRQMKVSSIEDLIAAVSLYRPGPKQFIPNYCSVKHGDTDPDYMHKSLEPILKETFGIIVYQEQVMKIAQVLAGYSLGKADLLRRAMGKKDAAIMEGERLAFVEGCVSHSGLAEVKATEIFNKIAKFAQYGFNKSHAAAYAVLAYRFAWLKHHYPAAYAAAILEFAGSPGKRHKRQMGAIQSGVTILPPCVLRSEAGYTVEGVATIRTGLLGVKSIDLPTVEAILKAREGKSWKGAAAFIADMLNAGIDAKRIGRFIGAGALDALMPNAGYRSMAWQSLKWGVAIRGAQKDALKNPAKARAAAAAKSIFDIVSPAKAAIAGLRPNAAQPWNAKTTLINEMDSLVLPATNPLSLLSSETWRKQAVDGVQPLHTVNESKGKRNVVAWIVDISSGYFKQGARTENSRSVVLIDGDTVLTVKVKDRTENGKKVIELLDALAARKGDLVIGQPIRATVSTWTSHGYDGVSLESFTLLDLIPGRPNWEEIAARGGRAEVTLEARPVQGVDSLMAADEPPPPPPRKSFKSFREAVAKRSA